MINSCRSQMFAHQNNQTPQRINRLMTHSRTPHLLSLKKILAMSSALALLVGIAGQSWAASVGGSFIGRSDTVGFALAPTEFALSTLRDVYSATLGHQVDTTNLQRVLARRGVISPTGTLAQSGRSGGRPAALYRFADSELRVTDEFAALRPPGSA